jgi:hypothetical protein
MTVGTAIIRTCSGGTLRIETPDGTYILSPEERRELLFFGRRILLRQADGTCDGNATAYLSWGRKTGEEQQVIIQTAHRVLLIIDRAFVSVANGDRAAAMLRDCNGVTP